MDGYLQFLQVFKRFWVDGGEEVMLKMKLTQVRTTSQVTRTNLRDSVVGELEYFEGSDIGKS